MTHIITDHHFLIEALEMVTILTLKLRLSQLIIIMILILESHLVPMELLILLEWDLDKVHLLLPQGLLQALAEEDKVALFNLVSLDSKHMVNRANLDNKLMANKLMEFQWDNQFKAAILGNLNNFKGIPNWASNNKIILK